MLSKKSYYQFPLCYTDIGITHKAESLDARLYMSEIESDQVESGNTAFSTTTKDNRKNHSY